MVRVENKGLADKGNYKIALAVLDNGRKRFFRDTAEVMTYDPASTQDRDSDCYAR